MTHLELPPPPPDLQLGTRTLGYLLGLHCAPSSRGWRHLTDPDDAGSALIDVRHPTTYATTYAKATR